ncbi:MAG: PHP domain-containing protein [Anaerolineaceae bacterium]|nr:PHP domain-containing protein [Anaerolineaceae bacterium]
MNEIIANIHIHTRFSDGSKIHAEIAEDAIKSGIDVLFFTDHNIHIKGIDGYYSNSDGKVLIIMGEEIHDQNAFPQKNHLLALGVKESLSKFADNRQTLIDKIHSMGGLSFIAHPYDPALPAFHETNISWEDWSVKEFTGIELWNGFSELKVRVRKKSAAYFYAFFPNFLPFSPPKRTLKIWDDLLNNGSKTVAIGGSDAHAIHFSAGPFKRVVFPYRYHFKTINNHILLTSQLVGNDSVDKASILNALRKGHSFIANDLIKPSNGFRFFIKNNKLQTSMGESRHFEENLKVQVILPHFADCILLRNGYHYHDCSEKKNIEISVTSPGIYRVECYKKFLGRKRGWIFSNPIYIE